MKLNKLFVKFVLFLLSCSSFIGANASNMSFFNTLQVCSEEQLYELKKEFTLDMSWGFGNDSYFRFISTNNEVGFEIY